MLLALVCVRCAAGGCQADAKVVSLACLKEIEEKVREAGDVPLSELRHLAVSAASLDKEALEYALTSVHSQAVDVEADTHRGSAPDRKRTDRNADGHGHLRSHDAPEHEAQSLLQVSAKGDTVRDLFAFYKSTSGPTRYEVLGKGSFGLVHRAAMATGWKTMDANADMVWFEEPKQDADYAVKVLTLKSAEKWDDAKRECRVPAFMRAHSNSEYVVNCFGYGPRSYDGAEGEEKKMYVVLELMTGSWYSMFKYNPTPAFHYAAAVGVLAGAKHLLDLGIRHGDIKLGGRWAFECESEPATSPATACAENIGISVHDTKVAVKFLDMGGSGWGSTALENMPKEVKVPTVSPPDGFDLVKVTPSTASTAMFRFHMDRKENIFPGAQDYYAAVLSILQVACGKACWTWVPGRGTEKSLTPASRHELSSKIKSGDAILPRGMLAQSRTAAALDARLLHGLMTVAHHGLNAENRRSPYTRLRALVGILGHYIDADTLKLLPDHAREFMESGLRVLKKKESLKLLGGAAFAPACGMCGWVRFSGEEHQRLLLMGVAVKRGDGDKAVVHLLDDDDLDTAAAPTKKEEAVEEQGSSDAPPADSTAQAEHARVGVQEASNNLIAVHRYCWGSMHTNDEALSVLVTWPPQESSILFDTGAVPRFVDTEEQDPPSRFSRSGSKTRHGLPFGVQMLGAKLQQGLLEGRLAWNDD